MAETERSDLLTDYENRLADIRRYL